MADSASTILIADDEPHVLYVVRFNLQKHGYEVLTASQGLEAFDIAKASHPALIVTDYQMPGGCGVEFAGRLHADPETTDIPVILLTARARKIAPDRRIPANVKALIEKPFSPSELVNSIDEILSPTGPERQSNAA